MHLVSAADCIDTAADDDHLTNFDAVYAAAVYDSITEIRNNIISELNQKFVNFLLLWEVDN